MKNIDQQLIKYIEPRFFRFTGQQWFYALIDISAIRTSVSVPTKSVFSQQYDSLRKRILVDGEDYDSKRK